MEENTGLATNGFQTTAEVNQLRIEMENLKAVNHAMWELMKASGMTDAAFNAALAGVIALRRRKDYEMNKQTVCPTCGKALQYTESFEIKCIYCGNTMVMNPYQKYNDIIDRMMSGEPEPQVMPVAEVPSEPVDEPYDINQDLKFDDV